MNPPVKTNVVLIICLVSVFLFGAGGFGLVPGPVLPLMMIVCTMTAFLGQFIPGQSVLTLRNGVRMFWSFGAGLVCGWLLLALQAPE
jgi:hypothetical protein